MNIREKAKTLNDKLCEYKWFYGVGIGDNEFFVYAGKSKSTVQSFIPDAWEGITVTIKRMSKPKLIIH